MASKKKPKKKLDALFFEKNGREGGEKTRAVHGNDFFSKIARKRWKVKKNGSLNASRG